MTTKTNHKVTGILNSIYVYDTFEEFTKYENSTEEEFKESLADGWYSDISCGTYNGASDTFDVWDYKDGKGNLIPDAIIDSIYQAVKDFDFFNQLETVLEDNNESSKDFTKLDYINEYTDFNKVLLIEDRLYVFEG